MSREAASADPVAWTGSEGAAGSAALRAALALSVIARRATLVTWADGGGISPEDLAAIDVARSLWGADVEGAALSSRELTFQPGSLKAGTFELDAGAQAVGPLMQMAMVPLCLAGGASKLRLSGLTHGYGARSFHDVAFGWLPLAERAGVAAELELQAAGFEADLPGQVEVRVFPAPRLRALEVGSRGMLVETQAIALVANLGIGIALPLERRLSERLRVAGISAQVDVLPLPAARARGLAAAVVVQFEQLRTAVVALGRAGHPPEELADEAAASLQTLLARRGALPGAVAEELMVPLAVAASPLGAPGVIGKVPPVASRLTTAEVTPTLLAIADVIRRFLPVEVQIQGLPGEDGAIDIRPGG